MKFIYIILTFFTFANKTIIYQYTGEEILQAMKALGIPCFTPSFGMYTPDSEVIGLDNKAYYAHTCPINTPIYPPAIIIGTSAYIIILNQDGNPIYSLYEQKISNFTSHFDSIFFQDDTKIKPNKITLSNKNPAFSIKIKGENYYPYYKEVYGQTFSYKSIIPQNVSRQPVKAVIIKSSTDMSIDKQYIPHNIKNQSLSTYKAQTPLEAVQNRQWFAIQLTYQEYLPFRQLNDLFINIFKIH